MHSHIPIFPLHSVYSNGIPPTKYFKLPAKCACVQESPVFQCKLLCFSPDVSLFIFRALFLPVPHSSEKVEVKSMGMKKQEDIMKRGQSCQTNR